MHDDAEEDAVMGTPPRATARRPMSSSARVGRSSGFGDGARAAASARARAAASGRETRFDHPPPSRLGGGPVTPIAERARRPATARAPSSVSRDRRDVHDRAPRAREPPRRTPRREPPSLPLRRAPRRRVSLPRRARGVRREHASRATKHPLPAWTTLRSERPPRRRRSRRPRADATARHIPRRTIPSRTTRRSVPTPPRARLADATVHRRRRIRPRWSTRRRIPK